MGSQNGGSSGNLVAADWRQEAGNMPKVWNMPRVQIDIADAKYAEMLRRALAKDWVFADWQVQCIDPPDLRQPGVIVLDAKAFERFAFVLPNPERVVLITPNDPQQLTRAWNAGIDSVVFEKDSLNMVMLAVIAARFRAHKSRPPQRSGMTGEITR